MKNKGGPELESSGSFCLWDQSSNLFLKLAPRLTSCGYKKDRTTDHFQTTIRAFQRRTPFETYIVALVSGDRVKVDHPEALVIRGGVGVFVSSAGAPTIFDHEGVSQIFSESGETAAA